MPGFFSSNKKKMLAAYLIVIVSLNYWYWSYLRGSFNSGNADTKFFGPANIYYRPMVICKIRMITAWWFQAEVFLHKICFLLYGQWIRQFISPNSKDVTYIDHLSSRGFLWSTLKTLRAYGEKWFFNVSYISLLTNSDMIYMTACFATQGGNELCFGAP